MADNLQNTSNTDTVVLSKSGLVTDLNSSYISKEQYSYARNAVRNTKEGDLGTISNEPSNTLCYSAPYKILGIIDLPDGTELVFSGNEIDSEIGLGNKKNCAYKTLKNLKDLKFSMFNQPITGQAKKDFNKNIVVTFTDKANPIRRVDLGKLPSLTNVDDIRLFKKIKHPSLSITKGNIGNIPNGTYSIAIAYSVDKQIFTDWYSITNRIQLYSLNGANSINIKFTDLDTNFTEFSVAVIGNYIDPTTKGATKVAKVIGSYSTKIKTLEISDFINTQYEDIKLSTFVVNKPTWEKAGIISANSNYLLVGDLVARPEENYQLKAMSIKVEYVVEQVPVDYYETDGLDVTYYRDENYDLYIQGVYNTGEYTEKWHIGGRRKKATDAQIVASQDAYEYDQDCKDQRKIEKWEVYNTAGEIHYTHNKFKCNRRILGYGEMGYFESTELYPDNKAMFGDDANTPIRFHKMPDECKVPRYEYVDGKQYINILGIRLKEIPKFDNPDIIGYRITRSDRKGGNGTVIARGLLSNVRSYTDLQLNTEVLYSNYTVNDLRPDVYLSAKQTTFENNHEHNFSPLTKYYKDRFNFYSPHTMFDPKYTLGSELKIESEEVADVKGRFEIVYNHPQQKLMNQFAFWLSAAVGFIEATLTLLGKSNSSVKSSSGEVLGQQANTHSDVESTFEYPLNSVEDLINFDIIGFIAGATVSATGVRSAAGAASKISKIIKVIKAALAIIASLTVKVPYSILNGIQEADKVFNIIYNFTGFTDYVYQYNAYATFNSSKCVKEGNKRRTLAREPLYIPSDVVSIDDKIYNNYFRESTTYLELNKELEDPSQIDYTRNTISGFGICSDITKQINSKGSMFYGTSKIPNPNQYGSLGSSSPVSMHSDVLIDYEESPVLYGGDCIIGRFQFQKKMQFFNQNMANANFPNGTEYDYKLYRNIAYPRFWMDTTKYDFSELLNKKIVNYSKFSRTTQGKHNLDCKKANDGGSIARIDDAYMYLSNNCIMDFIVEADYNINFRETQKDFKNTSFVFRSDKLEKPEEFKISRVYSDIYTTEIYAKQQRNDFDPLHPIPQIQENSVIYSLPSFNLQYADNWQYFLPANYFAFNESDFGKLNSIHKLDQDRIIFLFSKSSPFISMGRDFLQLEGSGRKVTIGDGGLFAQDPREIMPTDNNYGSCNSRFAFSNTHLGRYYPSSTQGRIMQYSDNLDDITRQGISYWCKNYMPIRLYDYFPEYPEVENPMSAVGYLTVFDSFNETVYIIKRDYSPIFTDMIYDSKTGKFIYKGNTVILQDNRYFNDISWTLSYSPTEKSFTSWHDWHPDLVLQTENHFMTVKGPSVWKHNETTESFCNFYGVDHPFEIEFVSNSGQQTEVVRNVEYLLEAYKYKNRGRDRFHVLNENFDRLIVRNTEQISPLLNLIHGKDDPEANLDYPKINTSTNVSWDVLYFKEENKYRINQFFDMTKDRGEFTNSEYHLFPVDESGYKNVINPLAIDINKPEEERKKFRGTSTKFRFIKTKSGEVKLIVKLFDIKKVASLR